MTRGLWLPGLDHACKPIIAPLITNLLHLSTVPYKVIYAFVEYMYGQHDYFICGSEQ